jgi:hypothetical protein
MVTDARQIGAEQRLGEPGIQLPAEVSRVVHLGVSLATTDEFSEHVKVADAASELLRDVFGAERISSRLILGVASLPLAVPVEIELIFEFVTTGERT